MTFADVLDILNIPTAPAGHHHVQPGWVGFDCALCSPGSQKYRCGYGPGRKGVHCWSCGYLNMVTALSLASGRRPGEVIRLTRQIVQDAPGSTRKGLVGGRVGKLVLPRGIDLMRSIHRRYLFERGFDPDEVSRLWGVMGIGLQAKLAWRLFIPITLEGRVVSWTTRSLVNEGRRYVNAKVDQEEVSAKSLLYGEERCNQSVVVVEGPTDVWRVGPGAVALLGLSYTKEQVLKISKYPVRAVCLDPEPFAQRVARRLCRELEGFPGKTYRVELGCDPGDLDTKQVEELRRRFLS